MKFQEGDLVRWASAAFGDQRASANGLVGYVTWAVGHNVLVFHPASGRRVSGQEWDLLPAGPLSDEECAMLMEYSLRGSARL